LLIFFVSELRTAILVKLELVEQLPRQVGLRVSLSWKTLPCGVDEPGNSFKTTGIVPT
jgi:hypothetical protein